jgi:hypothetical protein
MMHSEDLRNQNILDQQGLQAYHIHPVRDGAIQLEHAAELVRHDGVMLHRANKCQ